MKTKIKTKNTPTFYWGGSPKEGDSAMQKVAPRSKRAQHGVIAVAGRVDHTSKNVLSDHIANLMP